MKFKDKSEKLQWLKSCGQKILQLEHDRRICIVAGNHGRAYALLRAAQFGRRQFKIVADTLKP